MAEIVTVLAVAHAPGATGWLDKAPRHEQEALLAGYAAVLEEAAELVRDPALPAEAKRALIRAERVATPAAATLRIAFVTWLRARADYEASAGLPSRDRAAATVAIAAMRLDEAIRAANEPFAEFAALIRK